MSMSVKLTMVAANKSVQTLWVLMSALVTQAFSCPVTALVVMVIIISTLIYHYSGTLLFQTA